MSARGGRDLLSYVNTWRDYILQSVRIKLAKTSIKKMENGKYQKYPKTVRYSHEPNEKRWKVYENVKLHA